MSFRVVIKAIVYGLGVAFVLAMAWLTYAILSGPNVRTEYVSVGYSHTWAFLTVLAAAIALFILGIAASEER